MTRKWIPLAALAMPFALSAEALTPALTAPMGDSTPLAIARMHDSPALEGNSPRGLKLSPDGQRVTYLAPRSDNQHFFDLWQMEISSGKHSRLLDASLLKANELSDEEKARRERQRIYGAGIMEYDWSSDGKSVLIPSAGNLYLYQVNTEQLQPLAITGFATDAKVSPQGKFVSYIKDQNLFIYELATNSERQLTFDGGEHIKNGMAEFVAQEEMGRMTGYWWAPDDSALAYTRIDESPVELVTRNEIYADGIKLTEQRYPYAGKANVLIELGVLSLGSGKTTWLDLGADTNGYLARVDWLPDASGLSFQWQNRSQQQLDLRLASLKPAATESQALTTLGAVTLLTEKSDAWINLNDDLTFLTPTGFIWASERSGYKHLYLYDAKGQLQKPLTSGEWAVDKIEYVDEANGWVYFTGRKDTVIESRIYRVAIASGAIEDVGVRAGMHAPVFAKNRAIYLDYFSSLAQPPQVSLHDGAGKLLTWVEQNTVDKQHPLYPYFGLWQLPEFGTLAAADGQALVYRLFKPADFDATKQYPVVVRVYGGPHAQLVTNSWSNHDYFTQHLLQRGYLVFQLDNRGSANRGTRFEQVIYQNLGELEVIDQQLGVKYLRNLPYVADDRIAIFGHSYGGYMALMSKFKAPQDFKVAISGAPVTDWSLYDTHYTERYMGHPLTNAAGYQRASVLPYVGQYDRGLLMYHGMADDNVLFENSTRVYKALQDQGKLFQMIDYPGSKHSMQGNAVRSHLYLSIADFLDREL
ncbi:MAG: DPP IV N-terminal domain-containing protein [Shewanella sp.]